MASKSFTDLMEEKKRPDEHIGRYDAANVDIVFTSINTSLLPGKKNETTSTATFEMKRRGVTEEGSVTFTGHIGTIDPWTFEPVRKRTFKITKHTNNCPDWADSCWGDKSLLPYGTTLDHYLTECLREDPDKYLNQKLNYIYYMPYHLRTIERLELMVKSLQDRIDLEFINAVLEDTKADLHSNEAQGVLAHLIILIQNQTKWKKDHPDEKNETFEKKSSELIEELKSLTLPPKNTPM